MENPLNQPDPMPRHLSPSSSGRRTASPEFEFLTAATSPPLLSADELFVNGLLLPLSLLHLHPNLHPPQQPDDPIETIPDPSTEPGIKPDPTGSKRYYWKDIFKTNNKGDRNINKNKKKKNPTTTMTGADNTASININILWPFSRSRSAGTGSTRPKPNLTRKASSAPCSRSNSARKCPAASPSRVGVHLGRASPVWHARRPKPGNNNEAAAAAVYWRGKRSVVVGTPPVVRVLNLNVPLCIGGGGGGEGLVAGGEGTRGGNMFNFRSLFSTSTKKVL